MKVEEIVEKFKGLKRKDGAIPLANIVQIQKYVNATLEMNRDKLAYYYKINVEDLAQAHILALEYLKRGGKTDFFNLGTKEGNTVKEVFALCESITGQKIPVETMNRREGDPAELVANNSKAQKILRWKPEKTLEYSIKTAYRWESFLQKGLIKNA